MSKFKKTLKVLSVVTLLLVLVKSSLEIFYYINNMYGKKYIKISLDEE